MSSEAKSIAISILCTLLVVAMVLCLYWKYATSLRKRKTKIIPREEVQAHEELRKLGKNVKAVIMDEDGVEVLYLRKLEDGQLGTGFPKVVNPGYDEECSDEVVQSADVEDVLHQKQLEDGQPGTDFPRIVLNPNYGNECIDKEERRADASAERMRRTASPRAPLLQEPLDAALIEEKPVAQSRIPIPEQLLPPHPSPTLPPAIPETVPTKQTPAPARTPPLIPPPPPPPPPMRPSIPMRRTVHSSAATPSKAGGSALQLKRPPRGRQNWSSTCDSVPTGPSSRNGCGGPVKLKPLHWDKIISTHADHSVVWDEIIDGSLRFDDGLIETLFGYTKNGDPSSPGSERNRVSTSSNKLTAPPTSKAFIFETRKSQNAAIVLKSLAVSRKEIVEALLEGQGLSVDVLEKLTKIAPTQEEASKILQFDGNPDKLADAESFIYHILRDVPSAFTRFNAMLFRSNYDSDILHLKELLQTLELACKELRTRGLFLKLLEAILKAGNRMNAGTARGNAQGFNLTALGKLYDVKSTDGQTTLLHFVVEQVVRSEGRHRFVNGTPDQIDLHSVREGEHEEDFLSLGLQQLQNLSTEFSNVKKAATLDYENFVKMYSSLSSCLAEIQKLVLSWSNGEGGGFLREMKQFLEGCDEELRVVGEEQVRIMTLVKRTREYYQMGASRDKETNPFQLFVLTKDFLDMVDRVRADITQKLQKKRLTANPVSSPPLSPPTRSLLRFFNPRLQMVKDTMPGATYSSESEDDFR